MISDYIIREGRTFGSKLAGWPQKMKVWTVTDSHVHFTRRGVPEMIIMTLESFVGISVALPDEESY